LIYAKKIVTLHRFLILTGMKKIVVVALMAFSMAAVAQQVTPLSIQLAEFNRDSLRNLYLSQPAMYRASLDVVAKDLAKNADEVKAARAELKIEQAHAKEIGNSLKKATKMAASLKKLYGKERGELNKMRNAVEDQQKTLKNQVELNEATRNSYFAFLEKEQHELGEAISEVADRLRSIEDLENAIRAGQTSLQSYGSQLVQKGAELDRIDAQLKQRVASVQAEQKTAKTMK
jgi:chromosome segregation ATPase